MEEFALAAMAFLSGAGALGGAAVARDLVDPESRSEALNIWFSAEKRVRLVRFAPITITLVYDTRAKNQTEVLGMPGGAGRCART